MFAQPHSRPMASPAPEGCHSLSSSAWSRSPGPLSLVCFRQTCACLQFKTTLQPRTAAIRLTRLPFGAAVSQRRPPDDSCLFSVSSDWLTLSLGPRMPPVRRRPMESQAPVPETISSLSCLLVPCHKKEKRSFRRGFWVHRHIAQRYGGPAKVRCCTPTSFLSNRTESQLTAHHRHYHHHGQHRTSSIGIGIITRYPHPVLTFHQRLTINGFEPPLTEPDPAPLHPSDGPLPVLRCVLIIPVLARLSCPCLYPNPAACRVKHARTEEFCSATFR